MLTRMHVRRAIYFWWRCRAWRDCGAKHRSWNCTFPRTNLFKSPFDGDCCDLSMLCLIGVLCFARPAVTGCVQLLEDLLQVLPRNYRVRANTADDSVV